MSIHTGEVSIPTPDGPPIPGSLFIPEDPVGVVLFAHGSGSGRSSPRNRFVAGMLQDVSLATLLVDLATSDDDRFQIGRLAHRTLGALRWLHAAPETHGLPVGCFGSSTGAAAALVAAALEPHLVSAIVSRGGRVDLAQAVLGNVTAPTLLIVGGEDTAVLALNLEALDALGGPKDLEVVPGAGHLFEEPGALERVGQLAARWFTERLSEAHASVAYPL